MRNAPSELSEAAKYKMTACGCVRWRSLCCPGEWHARGARQHRHDSRHRSAGWTVRPQRGDALCDLLTHQALQLQRKLQEHVGRPQLWEPHHSLLPMPRQSLGEPGCPQPRLQTGGSRLSLFTRPPRFVLIQLPFAQVFPVSLKCRCTHGSQEKRGSRASLLPRGTPRAVPSRPFPTSSSPPKPQDGGSHLVATSPPPAQPHSSPVPARGQQAPSPGESDAGHLQVQQVARGEPQIT